MAHARDAKLALDYLTGTSINELASREQLSPQRVRQILDRVAMRVGRCASIRAAKFDPSFVGKVRRHFYPTAPVQADTPEAFFHEMLTEPRRVTL